MTEFELRTLLYEEVGVSTIDFEFWLTSSFAVLVAGYYAFSKLKPELQKTVQRLYILVEIVFLVRWFSSMYMMYGYNLELSSLGVDVGLQIGPAIATVLQSLLMVFGTITVVSVLRKMGSDYASQNT